MIKIRMQRAGRTHRPYYRIVATDSRFPRDGRFLEKLGQYDPMADVAISNLDLDGLKNWITKGAQLSDTVRTLLRRQKVQL
jgi:small subunit ribosomal protein S16